jgi:lipoprotein-anchoring transpeptidase ErfK/SrfK
MMGETMRWLTALGCGVALALTVVEAPAQETPPAVRSPKAPLKPGQYKWAPDRSPSGPVVVVVDLPDQMAYVYRDGIRIGVTTVSTGRPGHVTPTGVFTILQKQPMHHSTLYNDAPMPYMERLTWSGVCLHAGGLPGYPSSHGCVHLPLEFSKLLYGITADSTTVVIADSARHRRTCCTPDRSCRIRPERARGRPWRRHRGRSSPGSRCVQRKGRSRC